MKLFRKVLSVAAVMALVVTAMPAKAKAATDTIDFEDGNIPAGIIMALTTDGQPDGDAAILSVVDMSGSKMLKIDTQANGTPKVKFMLADLVGAENVVNVGGIECDWVIEQPSGEVAGWNGGTLGAGPWGAAGGWVNGGPGGSAGWVTEDYENSVTAVTHFKDTILDGFGFADEKGFFMYMNWANNGTDDYLDNIKILDKEGNPMPLVIGAAVDTATEDAATDDAAAADDSAAATDVPKTGVVDLSVVYGLAALATGAFALKRRNK